MSRSLDEKPSVEASKSVEEIQKIHELVKVKIERSYASYQDQANQHKKNVAFQLGYLVWIHLKMSVFPRKTRAS